MMNGERSRTINKTKTMLTDEQIKNLKKGDPLIIRGTFDEVDDDGDICIKSTVTYRGHPYHDSLKCAHPSCVSLSPEKPKYDPCRLFKKGDKVRVVEWNGRKNIRDGMIGEVVSDEFNCKVELAIDGWPNDVYYQACFLELVTPVEEREPYSAKPGYKSWHVERDGKIYSQYPYNETVSFSVWRNEEEAKAAAEAERDRLNAEWRKEQTHD